MRTITLSEILLIIADVLLFLLMANVYFGWD